jgi:hypothetical protein
MNNGFDVLKMIRIDDPLLWITLSISHGIVFVIAFTFASILSAGTERIAPSTIQRAIAALDAEAIEISDWLNFNGGDDDDELRQRVTDLTSIADDLRKGVMK